MNIEELANFADRLVAADAAGNLDPQDVARLAHSIGAATSEEIGVNLALQHGDLVLNPKGQE